MNNSPLVNAQSVNPLHSREESNHLAILYLERLTWRRKPRTILGFFFVKVVVHVMTLANRRHECHGDSPFLRGYRRHQD